MEGIIRRFYNSNFFQNGNLQAKFEGNEISFQNVIPV